MNFTATLFQEWDIELFRSVADKIESEDEAWIDRARLQTMHYVKRISYSSGSSTPGNEKFNRSAGKNMQFLRNGLGHLFEKLGFSKCFLFQSYIDYLWRRAAVIVWKWERKSLLGENVAQLEDFLSIDETL